VNYVQSRDNYSNEISTVLTTISNVYDTDTFATSIEQMCFNNVISSIVSTKRKDVLDWKLLADVFGCSPEIAKRTIEVTTRRCIRASNGPRLSRRYHTYDGMLRYSRLACDMFTDTLFAKVKSVRGCNMAQMFVSDFNYLYIGLLRTRSEFPQALKHFFKRNGVPHSLIADGAKEQVKGESRRLCNLSSCSLIELEKDTPWANIAELQIGLCKRGRMRELKRTNAPMRFWCYLWDWYSRKNNVMAKDHYQLFGQTLHFKAKGIVPDILDICEFPWYSWVYFRDYAASFPFNKERLGKYLGPAEHAGTMLSKWVLNDKGTKLPFQTLRLLPPSERDSETERDKR